MQWPRQRSESITSDSNVSGDCVPAGFLEHVRRLRNAEYHRLDNGNCACFGGSRVLEVGCERLADLLLQLRVFPGRHQVPTNNFYLSA
jgi:hypothetical protein